jgi:hypothetical protein
MSTSIEKFEWENKTRLLYFKHRGDVSRILAELRTTFADVENVNERFTAAFVNKIIAKFKREEKKNSPFVATWIMQYIFMGTKQREVNWQTDVDILDEFGFVYRSGCCDAATDMRPNHEGEMAFICLKCDKICNAYRKPDLEILEFKRKLRVEQRNDEAAIVQAIDKLGFGGEKPPVIKQYNNIVQVPQAPSKKKRIKSVEVKNLPESDQTLVKNLDDMDPRDRETVRKQLERIRRDEVGDGWPDEEK